MDLSKLSERDLQALAAGDLSSMSDFGLQYLSTGGAGIQRSWGEALTDVPKQFISGIGSLGESVGALGELTLGVGTGLKDAGGAVREWAEDKYSPAYQYKKAEQQEQIARATEEGGEWAGAWEAFKSTITDPALLIGYGVETVPSMFAGGAGGIATRTAAKAFLTEASKKTLQSAGVAGFIGSNAAIHAGDVGGETYERVLDAALAQGMDGLQAERIAITEAQKAAAQAAAVSAGVQFLPGGRTIERAFFPEKAVGKALGETGTGVAKGIARGAPAEMFTEGVEEGTGQVFGNIGVQAVDPTQTWYEGAGGAAGLGAAVGGLFGGTAGAVTGRRDALAQQEQEQAQRAEEARRAEVEQLEAARRAREGRMAGPLPTEATPALEGFEAATPATDADVRRGELRRWATEEGATRGVDPETVLGEERQRVGTTLSQMEARREELLKAGNIEGAGALQGDIAKARELFSDLGGLRPAEVKTLGSDLKKAQKKLDKLENQLRESKGADEVTKLVPEITKTRAEMDELNRKLAQANELQRDTQTQALPFDGAAAVAATRPGIPAGDVLTAEDLAPLGRSRPVRDLVDRDLSNPEDRAVAREVLENLPPVSNQQVNAAREAFLQELARRDAEQQAQAAPEAEPEVATEAVEGSLAAELAPGEQAALPLEGDEGVFPRPATMEGEPEAAAQPAGEQMEMFGPRGGVTPAARRTGPARGARDEVVQQTVPEAPVPGRPGDVTERPATESGVGVAGEPVAPAAPAGRAAPKSGRVGRGRGDVGAEPEGAGAQPRALEETQDAVQEQEAAPVPARRGARAGREVGEGVPAQEAPAREGAPTRQTQEAEPEAVTQEDRVAQLEDQIQRAQDAYDQAIEADDNTRADAMMRRREGLEEQLARVREGDTQFSGTTEPVEGQNAKQLEDSLKTAFNNPAAFNNRVTIVQRVEDLPADVKESFDQAEADGLMPAAMYDGKAKRVYMVADRVPRGKELGIFLHETGVHMGMESLLGPDLYKRLLSQVDNWAKSGTGREGELARRAAERAGVNEGAGFGANDEVLAYFVEEAVDSGINPTALQGNTPLTRWFRQLWAAVKTAIRRLGMNPDRLTAQQVVDLAYGAARAEVGATWHGTGADFRRFDHRFMGTGEGAQAFSWGTYLAQRPGIGYEYWEQDVQRRDVLPGTEGDFTRKPKWQYTDTSMAFLRGEESKGVRFSEAKAGWVRYDGADLSTRVAFDWAVKNGISKASERAFKQHLTDSKYPSDFVDDAMYEMRQWVTKGATVEVLPPGPEGNLMRVDVNARDDELLDWDTPISEQSKKVRDALEQVREKLDARDEDTFTTFLEDQEDRLNVSWGDFTGKDLIGTERSPGVLVRAINKGLVPEARDDVSAYQAASEYLDSLGIKGVKFFDALSRGGYERYIVRSGDGVFYVVDLTTEEAVSEHATRAAANTARDVANSRTRNLVIFNDKNIQRIYSQPGARRDQRKFSGRPMTEGDRILIEAGLKPYTPDTRSRVDQAKAALKEGMRIKGVVDRAFDWTMQKIDSSYPLLAKYAKTESFRNALPEEQVKLALRLSLAQPSHTMGMATVMLEDGGGEYDPATEKWKVSKSDFNGNEIRRLTQEMADKHGLTYRQAENYAVQALTAERALDLLKTQRTQINKAQALEDGIADKQERARAGGKQAEKLKAQIARDKKQAAEIRGQWERDILPMDEAQANTLMELFDTYPEIKKIRTTINGIRSWIKDIMVESGLWTEDKGQWLLDNTVWVPFKREFTEAEQLGMESFEGRVGALQTAWKDGKFKGSEREIGNVIDNFIDWSMYAMESAIRNHKARDVATMLIQNPDIGAKAVPRPSETAKNRTVFYTDGGVRKYVELDDPLLAAAFRGNPNIVSATLPIVGTLNRWMRDSIVLFPVFAASQVVMDSVNAMLVSGLPPRQALKIPVRAVREALASMRGMTETRARLRQYGAAGVADISALVLQEELNQRVGLRMDDAKKGALKRGFEKYRDWARDFALISDNATRSAMYQAYMDAGMTEGQAVNAAFEVINFKGRVGSPLLSLLSQTVPFFGAGLAALRANLKALGGTGISYQDRLQLRKSYAQTWATLAGLSMLFALANQDDEDYQKMTPEQRAGKLTIPGTGGWGIPVRPDISTLPLILAQSLVNQMGKLADDETKFYKALGGLTVETLTPTPLPIASPIKTLIEQVTNHSFFTGNQLVGTNLRQLKGYQQFGPTTSELTKMLGRWLQPVADLPLVPDAVSSPQRLEHILRSTFGMYAGMGLLTANLMLPNRPDMSANDIMASIPGLGRAGNKDFNDAARQDVYDLINRVDRIVSTANRIKQLNPQEYQKFVEENRDLLKFKTVTGRIERQLGELRRNIMRVMESDMPADAKRKEIERLRTIEQRYLANLNVKDMRAQAGL